MIETVTKWIKGDDWNLVPNIRDGLLLVIILSSVIILMLWYFFGPYYQGILNMYGSMTCAELKEMMINSSGGLGPIFRGHYSERCIDI